MKSKGETKMKSKGVDYFKSRLKHIDNLNERELKELSSNLLGFFEKMERDIDEALEKVRFNMLRIPITVEEAEERKYFDHIYEMRAELDLKLGARVRSNFKESDLNKLVHVIKLKEGSMLFGKDKPVPIYEIDEEELEEFKDLFEKDSKKEIINMFKDLFEKDSKKEIINMFKDKLMYE